MICIYEKNETSFTYNGLGTLEPSYCSFSPFINDVWQLEMYLPYDPEGKYKLVENGRILKVTGIDCIQEQTSDYQLFSIETYRKEGNSIYVLAYPVGMDARFDTYANQVNANYKTASEAIALINGVKAITLDNQQIDKYTVSTDIDSADRNSAVWSNTNIIAMLTNDENGFIHKWGGEVCYDNYNIKVNQALGRTSGASEVRYGKNIRGMSYEEDTSNVITRLYPVANGGETLNAIEEYKIADTQYVDSANVRDYPIPHIAYTNAPFNLVQMSNDGSTNYVVTFAAYELIRDTAANWLNDALLGENTDGVDGLLVDIELAWFVNNYALTLANDGTEGLAEYVTNNICNDGLNPIHSASVKNLIYEAVKAGFELVLKDDTSAAYVGPASKKMWDAPLGDHFYSYTWDSAGDFRVNKNGDADYAWVYASNKWQQLNDDGITTGTVDTAKWKWYKVSGKSFKRYGNKKKKRYLKNQWWNISGVWYLFGSDGKGKSGAELQEYCYEYFDVTFVNDKTIYEVLSPICKEMESDLFDILYSQMTDYCTNMFVEEKISFPTPSISIDMVDLSKTVEYAGYEHLLKIKLGDTVNCINTKLNISTDLRITGLTYDVIKGCNTTIQIGLTETSIIRELDRPNTDSLLEKQGLVAGHGIRIVGNVISATGMNLTDVFVNGQSAVYGGKAYIDLDEISGEGLQWFEETEDALFGYKTEIALVDDKTYKTATAGGYAELAYDNIDGTLLVSVECDDSSIMVYYPKLYAQKSPRLYGGVDNKGFILVLSKSDDITVHTDIYKPNAVSEPKDIYSDYSYISMTDGDQVGYIYGPYGPIYRYIGSWASHSSAVVNGETWYGILIGGDDTLSSGFRNLTPYLSLAEYPEPQPGTTTAYENLSAVISATVPLVRSADSGSYNGISREGNLAFFAGADDEHGTNAAVKIFTDGTTYGLSGNVDDVKVDNVSVVTNKVANINTMTGATSGADGAKGLVPSPLSADREKYLKGDGTWDEPEGTVVANPSGTATADLTSLQVGNDIYSIPSGGGGGLDVSEYDNWYHVYYTEVLTDEQTGNDVTLNVDEVITGYFYINKSSESSSVAYSEWLSQGMEVSGYALQADHPIEGIIETIEEARDGIYVNYRIKNTSGLYCSRVQVLTRWAIPKSGSGGGGGGGNTITYGTTAPSSSGNDGDLYFQLDNNNKKIGEYLYVSNAWIHISGENLIDIFNGASTITFTASNGITLSSSSITNMVAEIEGVEWSAGYEGFNIALYNLEVGQSYRIDFNFQSTTADWYGGYTFGYKIQDSNYSYYDDYTAWPNNLIRDLNKHPYSVSFVATTTTMYLSFNLCGYADYLNNYWTIDGLKCVEIN